jgi:hypothetical protein
MERGREVKGRVLAEAWELAAAGEKERAAAKGAAKAGVRDVAEGPVRDRDSAGEKNNKQRRFVFINQKNWFPKEGALRCQVEIERVRWEWDP